MLPVNSLSQPGATTVCHGTPSKQKPRTHLSAGNDEHSLPGAAVACDLAPSLKSHNLLILVYVLEHLTLCRSVCLRTERRNAVTLGTGDEPGRETALRRGEFVFFLVKRLRVGRHDRYMDSTAVSAASCTQHRHETPPALINGLFTAALPCRHGLPLRPVCRHVGR